MSLGSHLRALAPAFAERCCGVREVCGTFAGFVERFGGLVEPAHRTPFGGLVNLLGFGYLRLNFGGCGFDNLRLTLGAYSQRGVHIQFTSIKG